MHGETQGKQKCAQPASSPTLSVKVDVMSRPVARSLKRAACSPVATQSIKNKATNTKITQMMTVARVIMS